MNEPNIKLYDLSRLSQQLQLDGDIPLRELQQRDHAFGAQLQQPASDATLIKSWLNHFGGNTKQSNTRLMQAESSISWWLVLLGFIVGIFAMSGLLLIGENKVINVLLFLALFIGTQFLILLLTLVSAFSAARGIWLHLPLEHFNPARLLFRRTLHKLVGNLSLGNHVRWENFVDVGRFAVLRWGQWFGVAFNVGGLLAFLIILAATDRSFGWGSTFNISDKFIFNLAHTLSAPWSLWFDTATVDMEIVTMSRVHALQTEFDPTQVYLMREWWQFLFACIICYGLLPRLILLPLFSLMYQRRLERAFLHYPGVSLVLDRIKAPIVNTQGEGAEEKPISKSTATSSEIPTAQKVYISWAQAATKNPEQLTSLEINANDLKDAGVDLTADRQLITEIKNSSVKNIIIVVKGWEPPLAELGDFVAELNNSFDCYFLLLPLQNKLLNHDELQDWQHFAYEHNARVLLGGAQKTND